MPRRSFSHLTARNSKERRSGVKRGHSGRGGRERLRVSRGVKPCGTARRRNGIFARVSNSTIGYLRDTFSVFAPPLFFLLLSPIASRLKRIAVSRETAIAFGRVNFRSILRANTYVRMSGTYVHASRFSVVRGSPLFYSSRFTFYLFLIFRIRKK